MALHWRSTTKELLCAAKHAASPEDTYIDDRLHYELAVIQKCIVPDKNEETNGLWYWLHGICNTTHHPEDVRHGAFVRSEN